MYKLSDVAMKITAILATVAIVAVVSVGVVAVSFLSIVPQQHAKAEGCTEHNRDIATTCYFPGKNEYCTYVTTPFDISPDQAVCKIIP